FLRADVPLRVDDVDIDFGTPNKDWSSRLTRSTVNLFLYDIRRSVTRSVTGTSVRERNGNLQRVFRAPLIKVRYMLTVWTAEPADEHRVLGDVLRLIAISGEIPTQHLGGELTDLGNPLELTLGGDDTARGPDIWGPLGVPPRAALELAVLLPAREPLARDVPRPPTQIEVEVHDQTSPGRSSRRTGSLIEYPTSDRSRSLGPTVTT
ncbi:MAG: Pvc16 family protein, partial [Ilumatobacteraceae bacterium]